MVANAALPLLTTGKTVHSCKYLLPKSCLVYHLTIVNNFQFLTVSWHFLTIHVIHWHYFKWLNVATGTCLLYHETQFFLALLIFIAHQRKERPYICGLYLEYIKTISVLYLDVDIISNLVFLLQPYTVSRVSSQKV